MSKQDRGRACQLLGVARQDHQRDIPPGEHSAVPRADPPQPQEKGESLMRGSVCGETVYSPEASADQPSARCACGGEAVYDSAVGRNECARTGVVLDGQPPPAGDPTQGAVAMITSAVRVSRGRGSR